MFRNRELTVQMTKKRDTEDEPTDDRAFGDRAGAILYVTERLATRVFVGVCAYLVLDTVRQVTIEKSKHSSGN